MRALLLTTILVLSTFLAGCGLTGNDEISLEDKINDWKPTTVNIRYGREFPISYTRVAKVEAKDGFLYFSTEQGELMYFSLNNVVGVSFEKDEITLRYGG